MTQQRSTTLVVDANQPRNPRTQVPVDVAVGLLLRPDGRFLLCTRPPGKAYAGYWEFPGGKVEPGEDVLAALGRELLEEIGIHVQQTELWTVLIVDYPHALVRLHFCKVWQWSGDITMLEGQQYVWESHPVQVTPILPGTVPVLDWLSSEKADNGE
jgi:8-oxo-dGTP diphosphatase